MSTLFSSDPEAASDVSAAPDLKPGRVERPVHRPVDSNAVRWVLAATVAFWLAVYAAGHTFLS